MESQANNQFDQFICSEINEFRLEASFDEQWAKMSQALDSNSFMKFTPLRFNFYYLMLVISGCILSFFLYSNYIQEENPTIDNSNFDNKNNGIIVDSSSEGAKSYFKNKENSEVEINNNPSVFSGVKKSNAEEPIKDDMPGEKIKIDSVIQVKEEVKPVTIIQPDSVVKTKPVIKKIKYVTRRDTIIKVDTTRLKKRR